MPAFIMHQCLSTNTMQNNTFPVTTLEGVQVVDSRLIATELGIDHNNFMANLKEHQIVVESFGSLLFETEVRKRNVGATTAKFAYLNEDQALFMGTLSKNSPAVVEFKRKLVASFSQARQTLGEASHTAEQIRLLVQEQVRKQLPNLPDFEALINNEMIAFHLKRAAELTEANRRKMLK
jgi:phage regulator Rha-like protein